ncbi:MAG: aminodeoxychorismate/anthranilate synthase component II [Bacillota bacterium]|nr:aminodeoxychorismate/anthranilate synthase component II [Bacillota bacterium]
MVVVLDNYDSFTYNLVHYLAQEGGERVRLAVWRHDALTVSELEGLRPDGLVISPGPGGPEDAGISLEALTRLAPRVPVLGVCLGHQCLARAFGGEVVRARRPVHGKTSLIRHDGRGVYRGLPSPFEATRYHSLVVRRETLPPCLEVTAESEDGEVMGIRHREFPAEGVQFHPESILTAVGRRIIGNFLAVVAERAGCSL